MAVSAIIFVGMGVGAGVGAAAPPQAVSANIAASPIAKIEYVFFIFFTCANNAGNLLPGNNQVITKIFVLNFMQIQLCQCESSLA
jgi:hypothetical protein